MEDEMAIFSAFGNLLNRRAARKEMGSSPYRYATSLAINEKLHDTKLKEHWSQEAIERMAGWLWDQVLQIEADPNPIARCRYLLVDQTLARTKFETLLMTPTGNPTGCVGTQGVTGKLNAHIDDLFRIDLELRDMTGLETADIDWQTAQDVAVIGMWKAYWISSVFNVARVGLGDGATDETNWYLPFFHSSVVATEHTARQKLGWPSAIEGDEHGLVALAYGNMMDFALGDAVNPYVAWKNHYAEWIREGRLQPPF